MDRPDTGPGSLAARRQVVAWPGRCARRVGQRTEDAGRSFAGTIGIPSYEASFRTFSNRVVLDAPLSGDAARDARAIYDAIRKGSVFTTIDALAGPGLLDVHLEGASVVAHATRPRGAEVSLLHDGSLIAYSSADIRYDASGKPGAYRVEVGIPSAPGQLPIPWLVSNVVYVGASTSALRATVDEPVTQPPAAAGIPPFPWRIEKDPASSAILRTSDHAAELQYTLAAGVRNSQFVALATDVHDAAFSAMRFVLQADRPSRLSVQVRTGAGLRWGRSYYVDPARTAVDVRLVDLIAIGEGPVGAPDSRSLSSILLVADLTNTAPGHSGRVTVLSSELVR
jgi:hypothetical protein